jgi:hypothetical protein
MLTESAPAPPFTVRLSIPEIEPETQVAVVAVGSSTHPVPAGISIEASVVSPAESLTVKADPETETWMWSSAAPPTTKTVEKLSSALPTPT